MITVAIPTYNRGAIVAETVRRLLELDPPPEAIIVVDQSAEENKALDAWHRERRIRLIRLDQPSIPHAMNVALLAAATPVVLYVDDDVEPAPRLIAAHERAHGGDAIWAVVGQILQPGEVPHHYPQPEDDLEFHFNHDTGCFVANVMAGNLSVKREHAIDAGGFDENYVGVAYRFETDFALRLVAAGGKVWFSPEAGLRHLKLASGGLRSYGDHRSSPSPAHSTGDYYFAIHHRPPLFRYALRRLRRNVVTRYHATHPWTIPTKLVGELRGLLLARRLARKGRRLIGRNEARTDHVPTGTAR
jgi:GT2 family glycosyltransferase